METLLCLLIIAFLSLLVYILLTIFRRIEPDDSIKDIKLYNNKTNFMGILCIPICLILYVLFYCLQDYIIESKYITQGLCVCLVSLIFYPFFVSISND